MTLNPKHATEDLTPTEEEILRSLETSESPVFDPDEGVFDLGEENLFDVFTISEEA